MRVTHNLLILQVYIKSDLELGECALYNVHSLKIALVGLIDQGITLLLINMSYSHVDNVGNFRYLYHDTTCLVKST